MRPAIQILAVLLAVQIWVTWMVSEHEQDLGVMTAEKTFLDIVPEAATKVSIEQGGEASVVLEKTEGKWVVASANNFPVVESKLAELLDKLLTTKVAYTVGKTQAAAKQLRVVEGDFERKITVTSGDTTKTVYLGSSPGFKQTHARVDGTDVTYTLPFIASDASTTASDWFDRDLLKIEKEDITSVAVGDLTLKREGEDFVLADLAEDEEMNKDGIRKGLTPFHTMQFKEVLGVEQKDDYNFDEPVVEVKVELKGDRTVEFTTSKPKEGEDYVTKSSEYPYYFSVRKSFFDVLKEMKRSNLVKKKVELEAEEAAKD